MGKLSKEINNFMLNHMLENDIISMDEVLSRLMIKKRLETARKLHPRRINHSDKSGYYTYVDDATKSSGLRLIRKSTEEALLEELAKLYIDNLANDKLTLGDIYHEWISWKTTPLNQDNIQRIEAEWRAYYLNEPLSEDIINMPFVKITTLDLRTWAESIMKKHLPDKKKYYRMFGIINGCYEYASDEDRGIVPTNLWEKAKKKLNNSLMSKTKVPDDETQVFSSEEVQIITDLVYEDLKRYKKQSSSAGLQILFLLQTGLRIGECCALRWSDIIDNRLYISKQANNERVKDFPKTNQSNRDITLTDEAIRILEDVKAFNEEHGYNAEWIFQSNNPKYDYRLSYNAADRKLRKLCARLNSIRKSPHKLRKTVISTLVDDPNVNNRTAQRFAGHNKLSTTMDSYCFDRSSKKAQAIAINNALSPSNYDYKRF